MGFNNFPSSDGRHDYGCPLLELSKDIFTTLSSKIERPVSVVHQCLASVPETKLVYIHDWPNRMYFTTCVTLISVNDTCMFLTDNVLSHTELSEWLQNTTSIGISKPITDELLGLESMAYLLLMHSIKKRSW